MAWGYHNPVAVRFGWNALDQLPALVAGRRAVLVTFPEAAQSGLRERLTRLLGAALSEVIEDIDPNPEVGWFRARYASFWRRNRDCVVVAVGGGSVIDTAKVLQVGVEGGDFEAYFAALRAGRQPQVARGAAARRRAHHRRHRQRSDAVGHALGPQLRRPEEVFAARGADLARGGAGGPRARRCRRRPASRATARSMRCRTRSSRSGT